MNGGTIVASVLKAHGVTHLFTLCGGHISPILVGAERAGIQVVDVRDEAAAVFAADAAGRLTGIPGIAAVTAGPGLTNTVTALENALLAQTPLIVFGGATATILKGRGALQDIDQVALMKPCCKAVFAVRRVRHIGETVERAFQTATSGVPGPVFVELPLDLLYDEVFVREQFRQELGAQKGGFHLTDLANPAAIGRGAMAAYVEQYLFRMFRDKDRFKASTPAPVDPMDPAADEVDRASQLLRSAVRPVLVLGSGALARPAEAEAIATAIRALGIPTWLGGMARGLLGRHDPRQLRHRRGAALKKADVVIVAGFPFDFRLQYGLKINPDAKIVAIGRDASTLKKNRRPTLAIHADAGRFLQALARHNGVTPPARWTPWFETLKASEAQRDAQITEMAGDRTEYLNPIELCRRIEEKMEDDAMLVVDGGDFVATAAYVLRPRTPLAWLDPGVFGTLGVGGGFAVGAAAVKPGREIWLIYGDGASAYSLAEFDTLARMGARVIAVIGNDGLWAQIARDQAKWLGSHVGTTLERRDYHVVARGYGAKGLLLKRPQDTHAVLDEAKALAAAGSPVVINAWIGNTAFREGSISV